MDYEVVWTRRAQADLEAAVRHVDADSPRAAEQLRQDVLDSVEVLAKFPFLGPTYERDRTGRTREILSGRYRIFYRANEDAQRVEVLIVWHSARREPRLPD